MTEVMKMRKCRKDCHCANETPKAVTADELLSMLADIAFERDGQRYHIHDRIYAW